MVRIHLHLKLCITHSNHPHTSLTLVTLTHHSLQSPSHITHSSHLTHHSLQSSSHTPFTPVILTHTLHSSHPHTHPSLQSSSHTPITPVILTHTLHSSHPHTHPSLQSSSHTPFTPVTLTHTLHSRHTLLSQTAALRMICWSTCQRTMSPSQLSNFQTLIVTSFERNSGEYYV